MAGIFSRIFKIFQSEAHSAVDTLESPIKMTEQGIRDLKTDLQSSLHSLAEVKALVVRMRQDGDDHQKQADEYERKAMLLLQKMQKGELSQVEAERLATEALKRKEECGRLALESRRNFEQQQLMADKLQANVQKLKQTINQYDNELITLRARAKTADSMKKINRQLSQVDTSGTVAMLEKMKTKVKEEESLAEAYGEVAMLGTTTTDTEINKALASGASPEVQDSLAALKSKLGIAPSAQPPKLPENAVPTAPATN